MAPKPPISPGQQLRGILHGLAVGAVLYGTLAIVFALSLPVLWRPAWVARIVRTGARLAVPLTLFVGGVRVKGRGREHIDRHYADRGYILIANHASNLDPLALMKVTGRVDLAFVAKAETLARPLFGRMCGAIGWISVDRESPVAMKRFQESVVARKKSGWVPDLVIFPEGTRSEDGTLQPFRMGPFLLAAQTGLPIIPVIIRGTHPIHPKNALSVFPGPVRVDVLPPLLPPGKVTAKNLIPVIEDLKRRAEELYRAVPNLNVADGDLPVVEEPSARPLVTASEQPT